MANQNHETKAEDVKTNIYSREFKDRLKNLVEQGNFKREILFNGLCREYSLLTYEEQEKLSRKFKSFVSDNIISLMNSEVEYILNKSYEDHEAPFTWDDVENQYTFNYERAIEDILNAFESVPYNSIEYDTIYKNIDEDDQESINEFLDIMNVEDEDLNECSFGFLYDKIKDKLEEMDEDEIKVFINNNYNILGLDDSEYDEHQEVYQWFKVSSWLCDELNTHDEVVISSYNYWGRCTYGQSIELDGIMHYIFLKWWCN